MSSRPSPISIPPQERPGDERHDRALGARQHPSPLVVQAQWNLPRCEPHRVPRDRMCGEQLACPSRRKSNAPSVGRPPANRTILLKCIFGSPRSASYRRRIDGVPDIDAISNSALCTSQSPDVRAGECVGMNASRSPISGRRTTFVAEYATPRLSLTRCTIRRSIRPNPRRMKRYDGFLDESTTIPALTPAIAP